MNNQLIDKIIQANGDQCPEMLYKNPLLDRNVATALSKSFVKILNISNENSNINNNLRITILENIRKVCTTEPEGHLPIGDKVSEILSELYINQLRSSTSNSDSKSLDEFLIRKLKSLHLESDHQPAVNPEILQALINLNKNGLYIEVLAKDVLHMSSNNASNLSLIKCLWNNDESSININSLCDNLAIKMKPEIERLLLDTCYHILTQSDIDIENLFETDTSLIQLVKRSAISSDCFQISCSILNFLFIMANFDSKLLTFIQTFVKNVKNNFTDISFSVLYSSHLNYVVVLLDFDINDLPESIRNNYITPSLKYLNIIRESSEYDFIMLLSHFSQWFDVYFENQIKS